MYNSSKQNVMIPETLSWPNNGIRAEVQQGFARLVVPKVFPTRCPGGEFNWVWQWWYMCI